MIIRILLIPIALFGLHSSYIYISKSQRNKKAAKDEVMMRFFILFILAVIILGFSSRGWHG